MPSEEEQQQLEEEPEQAVLNVDDFWTADEFEESGSSSIFEGQTWLVMEYMDKGCLQVGAGHRGGVLYMCSSCSLTVFSASQLWGVCYRHLANQTRSPDRCDAGTGDALRSSSFIPAESWGSSTVL